MPEVNITSSLTPDSTKVTVDGKNIKGTMKNCSFNMYYTHPITAEGTWGDPVPCCSLRVETEETLDDGTVRCIEYEYKKEGEGDASVSDRVITAEPDLSTVLDFLKRKMQGKL